MLSKLLPHSELHRCYSGTSGRHVGGWKQLELFLTTLQRASENWSNIFLLIFRISKRQNTKQEIVHFLKSFFEIRIVPSFCDVDLTYEYDMLNRFCKL